MGRRHTRGGAPGRERRVSPWHQPLALLLPPQRRHCSNPALSNPHGRGSILRCGCLAPYTGRRPTLQRRRRRRRHRVLAHTREVPWLLLCIAAGSRGAVQCLRVARARACGGSHLAHEARLDLVHNLQQLEGHKDHHGLAASHINLLRRHNVQLAQLGLQVVAVGLQIAERLRTRVRSADAVGIGTARRRRVRAAQSCGQALACATSSSKASGS
jgi:hypothetical protein